MLPSPAAFGPGHLHSPLPLQGLTVLLVEDSRFASDALRLMCQRSGARFRRAGDMAGADQHLRCYRPDVAIVDLGLPDGRGEDLIRRLTGSPGLVLLATSGAPEAEAQAIAAGAQGFLPKPVAGLATFQSLILSCLPDARHRPPAASGTVRPDPLALRDDLIQAERALRDAPGPAERAWLAGFLSGLARQAEDAGLAAASARLRNPAAELAPVLHLLRQRIVTGGAFRGGAFAPRG
ncbi:MAG: response regulator [Rhodobacteraceae bacterium]|nr:response regulator [Paracoccaceae bacterium]